MDTAIEPLIFDLVDWLLERERTYDQVMHAWRSSSSTLPIWDEANRRGLVMTETVNGGRVVKATSLGLIVGELRRETRRQKRQRRLTP